MTLIEAVEQACREEIGTRPALALAGGILRHITTDAGAARLCGGLTPRIAYILRLPEARVRRQLHALERDGKVIKHRPYACTIRWWPVGFLERMRAAALEPAHA
jgi:hypothetical protein